MKDNRQGDQLWLEWEGNNLDSATDIQYYTVEHVSLDEEVVRRALASTLQRDGLADSLADGFKLLDGVWMTHEWAGQVEDEIDITICDKDGETNYGEIVDLCFPITVIHISL